MFSVGFGSCCDEVGIIPEIPARTLAAFGYESECLTGGALADKSAVFSKIRASIGAEKPVIGFGITVKAPMACLIVGYDGDGLYTRAFQPPARQTESGEMPFYSAD